MAPRQCWRDLLHEGARSIERVTRDAQAEARIVAAYVLDLPFGSLDSVLGAEAPALLSKSFARIIERRASGMPLQYAIGRWAFRHLELVVDDRVLIPRPETEVVVDTCLEMLDKMADTRAMPLVVDLGTGSGAIALSIAAERVGTRVVATDISQGALDVARANLVALGSAALGVSLFCGAWYSALPVEFMGHVDLLVSNPPYVSSSDFLDETVGSYEPAVALFGGSDGLDAYRELLFEAPQWLSSEGVVVLEIGALQAMDVCRFAEAAGFAFREIRQDLSGRDRIIVCSEYGGSVPR